MSFSKPIFVFLSPAHSCIVFNQLSSSGVMKLREAIRQIKRTVLTQEVLRVMLHCSRLVPWEVVVKHVDEVVLRMQLSGYTKKFR